MSYSYPITPYMQANMAQAMQAILTGGPLPPGCVILALPIEQAQQVLPQLMMNTTLGGNAYLLSQPLPYYGQMYQPQIGYYPNNNVQSTALVPYNNFQSQGYNQNTNYPLVPYVANSTKSKEKGHGRNYRLEPHSNVYNSSSFDTQMENLSWSRLFGHHHQRHRHTSKQPKSNQQAISYEPKDDKSKSKSQQQKTGTSVKSSSLLSSSSSSTTSDESIRRVTVASKPSTGLSASQQPAKGSLPFKYSSEFIPGSSKQSSEKPTKKDIKVRSDDVFIVKKTQAPETPKKK